MSHSGVKVSALIRRNRFFFFNLNFVGLRGPIRDILNIFFLVYDGFFIDELRAGGSVGAKRTYRLILISKSSLRCILLCFDCTGWSLWYLILYSCHDDGVDLFGKLIVTDEAVDHCRQVIA